MGHYDAPMAGMSYRVVINDRMLRSAKTGVGHYAAQVLQWVPRIRPDVEVVPFHARHISRRSLDDLLASEDDPRAARRQRFRPPWFVRRILQAGYERVFRWTARRAGYSLYHEPNHIPIRCGLPTVTTIHDLSVVLHPEWHPADRIAWYRTGFDRGLATTDHFIAASRFTRDQCVQHLGISPERITVIYQAPREEFDPVFLPPPEGDVLRAALNLPDQFLLFVGTIEPRKNLVGLFEAYAHLEPALRARLKLVIVGQLGWETLPIQRRLRQLGIDADVRFVGYLGNVRLAGVMKLATALVFPSHYEGFGLPPLEAMACGCPCIVSNASSLPEVVGDAALQIDPQNPKTLNEAIAHLVESPSLADDLRRRGPARAAEFTWRRFAEQHDTVYRQVLKQHGVLPA